MIKNILNQANLFILTMILPFLGGCLGSGGGSSDGQTSSVVGLLFGGVSFGSGGGTEGVIVENLIDVVAATPEVFVSGGVDLAVIHNPEPATLLLLGGSILTMAFFKRKK